MILDYILPISWVKNIYFQTAISLIMLYMLREIGPFIFMGIFNLIVDLLKFIIKVLYNFIVAIPFQLAEMCFYFLLVPRKKRLDRLYMLLMETNDIELEQLINEALMYERDIESFKMSNDKIDNYLIEKHGKPKYAYFHCNDKTNKPRFFIDLRIIGKGVISDTINEFFYLKSIEFDFKKLALFFERRRKTN